MGGKSTTSTSKVEIPPEVMARYKAVNERAETVSEQPFQQYGGQFVAPLSSTQQAGVTSTNQYSQAAQPYYGAATGLTLAGAGDVGKLTGSQIGQYMDPYVGSVVAPTLEALQQQQGQERTQQQAQAIKSGAFGGDRAGLERANLARQQNLGTAQAIAPLLSQAYGQAVQTAAGQQGVQATDLARKMQAGQQIAGLGTGAQQAALQGAQAQIGAGTLEQQTQQADLTARYQQFLQERGYDFQVAQFLANIAMGTGALSGSTTTTTQPGGFFSDERLKDNIEPIGKTFDGQPIYRYDYGDGRTQLGLIAQDVLERGKPGVGMDKSGYLTVNYRDATDDAAAMASMGGAVEEPGSYERGGYVGGGLVGSEDIKAILASQAQAFGPFSPSGLYGGSGAGAGTPGATGIVPSAKLPVPKLVTASGSPSQPPSGMSQAISTGKGIADLYKGGKELKKEFQEWTKKAPDPKAASGSTPAPAAAPTAAVKPGLNPDAPSPGAKPAMFEAEPNTPQGFYVPEGAAPAAENISEAASAVSPEDFFDMGGFSYGGLVPRGGYDEGGPVEEEATMPYGNDALGNNADILGDVVKAGTPQNLSLPKPGGGAGGGGKSGGIGSDLLQAGQLAMMGAKAAPMIAEGFSALMAALPFSDARLKHNIEPVGKTFDGQNIYRYDMGDGKTQIGLMAQEVLERHPDAVGERDGYLTLDYDRATEDASPFAYGGLIPRQAHADGEAVIPDYSEEADLPAVGAIETEAQAAPDYRAMAIEKAKKHGVDPDAMLKTIQGESSFNPRAVGDEGSSAGLGQFHVAGISKKYPNPGLGDEYFKARRPELAEKMTPQEKIAYLSDPANAEDKLDYMAEHASKKGFGAWTAARNAGLVPGARPTSARADVPAEGASEAQYRNQEPGLIDSIGEKLTSERYMVPALSFLGSMLASKSPFLGQAIGEGLVGGVAGYQSMQKQQMETAKSIVDMVGNRFERFIKPGDKANGIPSQVMYRNKLTSEEYLPNQMSGMVYGALKSAGIPPEMYGVSKPASGGVSAPSAPSVPALAKAGAGAGAQAEKGAEGAGSASAAAPAKAAPAQKDIVDMSKGELKLYFEKNPEAAGFEPNDPNNPQAIRRDIIANQERERAAVGAGLSDEAAKAQAQVKYDQDRLDRVLNDAADYQAKINEKRGELTTVRADQYMAGITPRLERVKTLQAEMKRLGDIYSGFAPGRAEPFKAEMISWANGLGLGDYSKTLRDKLANVNAYDEAVKITMDEVYKNVVSEGLVRAPAASAAGLSKTTPGPNLGPGAVYSLIGRVIGESEHVRKRDEAYLDERPGTDPTRFVRDYERKDPYAIKKEIARGLSSVPLPKDPSIRAQVDSLYKTYGPYGYKPMGTEEAAPQPVTSGTVNNIPFKVVQ